MKSEARSSSTRLPGPAPGLGFAKRLLVVDPDQREWELLARLLIALGYVVHRINHMAEAPPRWPQHLYDLVVVATEDPASPEIVEFCNSLKQVEPPVRVALLVGDSGSQDLTHALLICRQQSATAIAEAIARLIR